MYYLGSLRLSIFEAKLVGKKTELLAAEMTLEKGGSKSSNTERAACLSDRSV